jgi:hypothetical protein
LKQLNSKKANNPIIPNWEKGLSRCFSKNTKGQEVFGEMYTITIIRELQIKNTSHLKPARMDLIPHKKKDNKTSHLKELILYLKKDIKW